MHALRTDITCGHASCGDDHSAWSPWKLFLKGGACCAGSWDVSRYGPVYALAVGPYGALLALCWQRDAEGQPSHVVWLDDIRGESSPIQPLNPTRNA